LASAHVWNLATGQAVRELRHSTGLVTSVAVTADGRWAISAADDETLKVWDLTTGRDVRRLTGHTFRVNGVAVTADGRWAVSASGDKTLKVWDLTTGQAVLSLAAAVPFYCCAIAPDGKTMVAGDDAGAVHFVEWVGAGEIQVPETAQEVETRSGWWPRWLKGLLRQNH
jgi:WD40 repeat protein